MARATAGMPVESFPAAPPPKRGTIPDVVGLTSAQAQRKIEHAKFTPIAKKIDSFQPVNTVLTQSPEGGVNAPLGGGVTIFVSNGKGKPVTVPRVVGLAETRAVAAIEKAGLVAKVRYVDATDKHEQGVVVSQTPIGNKVVDRGTKVVLSVGRKPPGVADRPRRRPERSR
jgi:serine/threonine-protein kinase